MPGVRALIDGASLGPEALKVVGRAFDEAWAGIASPFSRGPTQVEGARLALATAILVWRLFLGDDFPRWHAIGSAT